MSERVALVTGSTSGIGAATARRLARDGYKVALHSRRSADIGRRMAGELAGASYHQADLADEQAIRDLVAAVVKHHGRLDVLVNNAGESPRIPHADLKAATPAVWRRLLDINLIAPFLLITEAEAALRQAGETGRPACIVNIGTHAGTRPKGASIPYAAAKAGLHHVTRLLALSLGPAIRVNCVAPGPFWTPLIPSTMPPEKVKEFGKQTPMKRPGQPAECAPIYVFLATQESSFITGEVFGVTGGNTLP